MALCYPPSAGSLYYNYKGFHSVISLALVDAEYKFLFTDVGANGNCSDSTIFKECDLFDALQTGNLKLPEPKPLPKYNEPLPYYTVGDDAFGLRTWLMKPYPHRCMTIKQRIYNYRLSRAWRVVENTFGILVHHCRCMLTTMQQHPHRVQSIVMACCIMHNLLTIRYPQQHAQVVDVEDPDTHNVIPGAWQDEEKLVGLQTIGRNTSAKVAKIQRNYLKDYYNSPIGKVSWQEKMI